MGQAATSALSLVQVPWIYMGNLRRAGYRERGHALLMAYTLSILNTCKPWADLAGGQ